MPQKNNSRYEVGDRVIIRDASGEGVPFGFTSNMRVFVDTAMTINRVNTSTSTIMYNMEEDGGAWNWCAEMFAGLEPEEEFDVATDNEIMDLLSL